MKTQKQFCFRRLGISAAPFLFTFSLQADPISIPEKSVTPEISFLIGCAILLEATCILLLLRRFRKPRLFILWILGMHLITYPAFLGLLWLLQDMRPAFAVASGEGLVVLIEGSLIYLICRFVAPAKPEFPAPSIATCLVISLIGNVCSAVAFPILLAIF